jgi:hypothetical protein
VDATVKLISQITPVYPSKLQPMYGSSSDVNRCPAEIARIVQIRHV